jgi:fructose-1,6-bisphosphatase/inositol monophosphatase family enzyme
VTRIDLQKVAAAITEAAQEEIVPRFGKLDTSEITEKGPNDLVTVADLAMEARLTRALPMLLPGSIVVGEEAVSADESVQDRLDGDQLVWVIDPVDGTNNFARANPLIAVIIALVRRGETIAGWIHDPLANETAMAEKGSGVWWRGERQSIAKSPEVSDMLGSLSAGYFPQPQRAALEERRKLLAGSFPLFCAGQEYLRLIDGRHDFSLYNRIKPWDHAAGVLLHAEAGGFSAKHDGSAYKPTDRTGGLLMANDQDAWNRLHTALFGTP